MLLIQPQIQRIIQRIEHLRAAEEIDRLAQRDLQCNRALLDACAEEVNRQLARTEDRVDAAFMARKVATIQFHLLAALPDMLRRMMQSLDTRSGRVDMRAAMSGVLIYVIHPDDVVPEREPGALGLVDDAAFLYAMLPAFWPIISDAEPPGDELLEQVRLQLLVALDMAQRTLLQKKVEESWQAFHLLSYVPLFMAEFTLAHLLDNPQAIQLILSQPMLQPKGVPASPSWLAELGQPIRSSSEIMRSFGDGGSSITGPGGTRISFGDGSGAFLGSDGSWSIT